MTIAEWAAEKAPDQTGIQTSIIRHSPKPTGFLRNYESIPTEATILADCGAGEFEIRLSLPRDTGQRVYIASKRVTIPGGAE